MGDPTERERMQELTRELMLLHTILSEVEGRLEAAREKLREVYAETVEVLDRL